MTDEQREAGLREAWGECREQSAKTGLTKAVVQLKELSYSGCVERTREVEKNLNALLTLYELGECDCDFGESGGNTSQIFLDVRTDRLADALPIVLKCILKMGLGRIARIDVPDYEAEVIRNYWPQTATPLEYFSGANKKGSG